MKSVQYFSVCRSQFWPSHGIWWACTVKDIEEAHGIFFTILFSWMDHMDCSFLLHTLQKDPDSMEGSTTFRALLPYVTFYVLSWQVWASQHEHNAAFYVKMLRAIPSLQCLKIHQVDFSCFIKVSNPQEENPLIFIIMITIPGCQSNEKMST